MTQEPNIKVNSRTYDCWHEMGHAFACIELGGEVACVELIDDHDEGRARARCETNEMIRKRVACGGFAAEFVLLRDGDIGPQNKEKITQVVFQNAAIDRIMFHSLEPKAELSKLQDIEFMECAVNEVASIIRKYKDEIGQAVRELEAYGSVSGERIKEIIKGL
jgi:hypothetical protein